MIYSDNCFTIQVIDLPTINTILIIIQKDFGSKNILMNLEVALKHLKKFRQHFADFNDLNTLVRDRVSNQCTFPGDEPLPRCYRRRLLLKKL